MLLEVFKKDIFENISVPIANYRFLICGAIGFFFFFIISEWIKNNERRSPLKFKFFIAIFLLLLAVFVLNLLFIENYYVVSDKFYEYLLISPVVGFFVAIIAQRGSIYFQQKFVESTTTPSPLEKSKKSDIRDFKDSMLLETPKYNPKKYFKKNAFFLALDEQNKPIYWHEDTLPHIQVCGTSGCGKGVFISNIAIQCLNNGEAVFILDPKDDDWAPHSTYQAAQEFQKPFYNVNLNTDAYQFNIFAGTLAADRFGMLSSALGLEDTGDASDFYRLEERDLAHFVADNWRDGQTFESFYKEHHEYMFKQAKGFAYKFKELANIKAINAKDGLSFKDVIEQGGMVYIVGSMDDSTIKKINRMVLTRILQIAKSRDRISGNNRQICVVLDELKYHISRPSIEALGAARDKGLHVIMAHQSYADLRDCTSDLNKDAVEGAVVENSSIKMIYRVEMPEMAKVFAEKSGSILIDKDIRTIERALSGAESTSNDRKVAQDEAPLIDLNRLLTFPKRSGVLFGVGLAKIVHTSPYIAQKDYAAIQIQEYPPHEVSESTSLDFGKL